MRTILTLCVFLCAINSLFSQKMLLIERANRAKTVKLYIGDELRYRLKGKEDYWYRRTITDMFPETKTLMLDNFAVRVDDIAQLKVDRKYGWRLVGGALFTFGASLTLATTVGRYAYNDRSVDVLPLYSTAAVSLGAGWFLNTPRKLKLGKKHRLRVVEVKFPDPLIPVFPGKS